MIILALHDARDIVLRQAEGVCCPHTRHNDGRAVSGVATDLSACVFVSCNSGEERPRIKKN